LVPSLTSIYEAFVDNIITAIKGSYLLDKSEDDAITIWVWRTSGYRRIGRIAGDDDLAGAVPDQRNYVTAIGR
jgi:hypothetical protein